MVKSQTNHWRFFMVFSATMVTFHGDFTKKNGDVGDAAMKNGLTVSENTVIFHGIFLPWDITNKI